jgi:tetratricopeptide (TPR) repeat protein
LSADAPSGTLPEGADEPALARGGLSMVEAESGEAGDYVAFISYSHKDMAIGRWLHRKLEGYRLPKRLAGTQGEQGEVPARLTPIFRDRDDLPAAGDLSERVRAALAVSRNLIVLCSASSAASPWVAKEIATFRELHPGRPIFTAIVDGEPLQCFSPALLEGGAEPLAADLRKQGDGRRLGLLKLVAGLAGVGLDALIQRDATRRLRRVTYVTAAAVAGMLAMAVMTTMAFNARAEAQRQRTEAEGLVEFMLTDLRNKLRTVGRIDIMEAVNRQALNRYRGQESLKDFSGPALSRRARILQAIGEDELTLGHADKARVVFGEAFRTTAEQLVREPASLRRQLEHARSTYWVGRVNEVRKEWPWAQWRYQQFADAADRLVAAEPTNAEYMREVGWSRIDLGNIQLNGTRDYSKAQQRYEEAILWFHRALAASRSDETARILANAYGWLADSYFMRKLYRESLEARQRQYRIARALNQKHPQDADEAYRLAIARRAVARSLAKVDQGNGARRELIEASAIAGRLNDHDPRNGEWLMLRAMIGCDLLYTKAVRLPPAKQAHYRTEVTTAAAELRRAGNGRLMELSNCLKAIHVEAKG